VVAGLAPLLGGGGGVRVVRGSVVWWWEERGGAGRGCLWGFGHEWVWYWGCVG